MQIVEVVLRDAVASAGARRPTERLAWLIIVASIPAGRHSASRSSTRCARSPQSRELAAIFLTAQRLRCCSRPSATAAAREVRELAIREGAKPDGGRELDTLDYTRGAASSGVAAVGGARRGHQPRRASRWARAWRAASTTATRRASRSCSPRRSSSRRASTSCPDLARAPRRRDPRAGAGRRCISRGHHGRASRCAFLMRYFKTRTLMPFAIYCIAFGGFMVVYTLS